MSKKGKYAEVLPSLKPLPIEMKEGGTKYQEKVDAEKREIHDRERCVKGLTAGLKACKLTLDRFSKASRAPGSVLFALEYRMLYDLEEAADMLAKATRLQMEARSQRLHEAFEVDGVSSLTLADGAVLREESQPYCTTKDPEGDDKTAQNEQSLRAWLRANGHDDLLKPNFQTINSMAKEMLKAGMALPDGVNVFSKTTLKCTR